MLNLVWNSTLNRIGAGAVWFFIASSLPGGLNYFSTLGIAPSSKGTTTLFEGALFVIASYFLGSVMVGMGRMRITWLEEFALASQAENTFLQTALMSYVDRSDAFAGLGATLLTFLPMLLFYLVVKDYYVAIWLLFAVIHGMAFLYWARIEHANAKRLLSLHNALALRTP